MLTTGGSAPHPAGAISSKSRSRCDRRIDPTLRFDEYGLDNPQIMIIFFPRNADNSAGQAPVSIDLPSDIAEVETLYNLTE